MINKIYVKVGQLKNNQLFKDSAWSLIGNVIGKGLALLAGILVARFLGKDIYGEYGMVRNTILTIGTFSTFGLGYTATKFVADFKFNAPHKLSLFIHYSNKITLIFSGMMAISLFLFSNYIAIHLFNTSHLDRSLRLLAVLIVFNAITTTQIGVLSGYGMFKKIAQINSVIGVLTFFFSVILTYYYDLYGALLALIFVQIINCGYNYMYVRKATTQFAVSENIDTIEQKTLYKSIIRFSTPIALQEAVYSSTAWISSLLLVRFASFGDLGMYSAAMQWNAIILFIPGILRNVILSHLSKNMNNEKRHEAILKQTILINFFATIVPALIVSLFSVFIARSYGNSFQGLELLISLSVFSTVFSSISNVYAQAYMSKGLNWVMLLFRTIRDVSAIVLFIVFMLYFNFDGAESMVISHLIFSIVFLIITVLFYNKKNKRNVRVY
ncbi:oligosaccharide flippase family protein [Massilibacteroides sp.]|uniref:oligosaccharide flippase family protein n=1 Tax=Massilibacteroides sp. TaxID=2034766 RepID=UPI002638C2FD|nr:oligosaccharide flippase family protein [Massilibacteroides sp.]MDD4515975.1 oligosaccharide flippase family protein [Massilibacteroides sp.]